MGIQWKDSLSIGVAHIDSQHRELIERFAKLQDAAEGGKGMEELGNLMNFLEEYALSHFKDEEALQILHNYPAFEAHRSEHAYFIKQLDILKQHLNSDGESLQLVAETGTVLTRWLLNHICNIDMELGGYLKTVVNNRDWLHGSPLTGR